MVLTIKYEFRADTLSFVGNFSGSCIIFLNGEAITIKQSNGMEVAKWPYNCIRQFRAEEESGKFSFVSGRRGPYGVAEYNFSLSDSLLLQLQSALTQFTGAQFNQLAQGVTGGGAGQQQIRPRPPSTSSTSSYGTGGSRSSLESSPIHRVQYMQASKPLQSSPKLPPRDYLNSLLRGSTGSQSDVFTTPSPLLSSEESAGFGGYAKARPRMNKSSSEILPPSTQSVTPPPRLPKRSDPTLPGATSTVTPPAQSSEGWILKSQSYEQTKPKPAVKPKPDGGGMVRGKKAPPIPPKRSPLTELSSTGDQQENVSSSLSSKGSPHHIPKYASTSSIEHHNLTHNLRKQQTEPTLPFQQQSTSTTPSRHPQTPPVREHIYEDTDQETDTTSSSHTTPTTAHNVSTSQQSSHNGSLAAGEHYRKRSKSFSPEPTLPKLKEQCERQSASQEDDASSNLDFLPRSSPQVRVRSITPEYAQHLRKFTDQDIDLVSHGGGRQSPSEQKKFKRSKTVPSFSQQALPPQTSDTYDVPKSLTQQSSDEGVYHVPTSLPSHELYDAEGTYHVPRSSADVYHVPRSQEDIRNTPAHYHHPKPADSAYKVPVPADSTYSVPRSLLDPRAPTSDAYYSYPPDSQDQTDHHPSSESTYRANTEADNVYKVPRAVLEEADLQSDGVYKVPKSILSTEQNGGDYIYNIPRSSSANDDRVYNTPKRHNSSSPPASSNNTYETIGDSSPRGGRGVLGRLRAARSVESLLSHRVTTTHTPPIELSGPHITPKPNLYVGMDMDQVGQQQLPQVQAQMLGRSVLRPENLYAEIPDDIMVTRRQPGGMEGASAQIRSSGNAVSHSHYDTLPLRKRAIDTDLEGLVKAQELHDEGYELCLPRGLSEEQFKAMTMTLPNRSKAHGTPPRQIPSQHQFRPLDKYGIDRVPPFAANATRRHSEGLVLETSTSSHDAQIAPETVLGSSIPTESTLPVLDEYVIITRQDTRPKIFHTQPQMIPTTTSTGSASGSGSSTVLVVQGRIPTVDSESSMSSTDGKLDDSDEYELMNSVKVNLARLKYSTPNPSLRGGVGVVHTTAESKQPPAGGVTEHFYGNTFHPVSSVDSMNSLQSDSVFSDKSSEFDGESSPHTGLSTGPIQIPSKKIVRIASGSPHDSSLSLRNRSCSVDNILDNGVGSSTIHEAVVPSTAAPTTSSTNTTAGTGAAKKHNYVNVSSEDEQRQRAATQGAPPRSVPDAAATNKRPMPLPRPTLFRPEDSSPPAAGRKHKYEMVELSKVKGNDNPLSSKDPDTPQ